MSTDTNGDKELVLGVKKGKVRISPYHSSWSSLYEEENERVLQALGDLIVRSEHIGSTSIPGLAAKPIIDMMVGVSQFVDVEPYLKPLTSIGYEYAWWADVADDFIFGKGNPRTHLLHIVEHEGINWKNHVLFRGKLRGDAALAREYEQLKIALSEQYREDRPSYTRGKAAFIQRVIKQQ